MRAKTISISYEPGEFYKTQGHKGGERKHRDRMGRVINPTGFGWGSWTKIYELNTEQSLIRLGLVGELLANHPELL